VSAHTGSFVLSSLNLPALNKREKRSTDDEAGRY